REQIDQSLTSMSQVASVTYESQAQAYQRFKQEFSNSPSFVSTVQQGDIPDSFQIKLKNPQADYGTVAAAVDSKAGVDSVIEQRAPLDKIFNLSHRGRKA